MNELKTDARLLKTAVMVSADNERVDLIDKCGDKKYSVIYADPAWDYGKMKPRKHAHKGGNPQSHYPTMSIKDICNLPINNISDDCSCLFMWVTNPKLKLGFEVMEAWGFKYQTTLTWVKTDSKNKTINQGMGFYFRGATEHILFGTKGGFKIPAAIRVPNVIHAKRRGHSRKPLEMYDIINKISSDNKIELFARNKMEGWDSWGNETDKFDSNKQQCLFENES